MAQQQSQSPPLAVERITLAAPSEVGVEIEARSPGASWKTLGAEAAAVRITVNGKYNQDLLLWAGDQNYTYRVALGRLPRGPHRITVELNEARSAKQAKRAEVRLLRATSIVAGEGVDADDLLAHAHSPILYARANTIDRFTDLPLLMYYEIESEPSGDKLIRYTTIFTHEDGGTPAVALMSRWGV
ncbi:MAG: hypothetical protein WKF30_11930 [Pyrinomonadaceae bacterium]